MKKPMIIGTLSVIVLAMLTSVLMFSSSSSITEKLYWGVRCETENSCILKISGGEIETIPEGEEETFVSQYTELGDYTVEDSADWNKPSDVPWYKYRTKIVNVVMGDVEDIIVPSTMYAWFYGMTKITNIDFSYVDSSWANDMSYLFYGCTNLVGSEKDGEIYLDLSGLNTQNASSSKNVFTYTDSLNKIGVGIKMNLSFEYGFWKNTKNDTVTYYTEVPIGVWVYENVTNRYYWGITDGVLTISSEAVSGEYTGSAYEGAKQTWFDKNTGELVAPVTKVRVGTSTKEYKPQTLRKLFANLKDVTEIDLMYLNTTDTIDMNYLFYNCKKLTSLNLSNLDTTNSEDKLETVDGIDGSNLFMNCTSLKSVVIGDDWGYKLTEGRWLDSNDINYDNGQIETNKEATYRREALYFGILNDGTLKISNEYVDTNNSEAIDLSNILEGFANTNKVPWHASASSITKVKVVADEKIKVKKLDYWFKDLKEVTSIDLSGLDASEVETMRETFRGMSKIKKIDLSNLEFTNLKELYSTFAYDVELEEVNFGTNFNPTGLYNLEGTFSECAKLKKMNLHNMVSDYENPNYNMASTFSGCTSLVEVDITNLKINEQAKLYEDYAITFNGCTNLGVIHLGDESIEIMQMALGTLLPDKEWYYIANNDGVESIETVESINAITIPGTYYKEMPKSISYYSVEGGSVVAKEIALTGSTITLEYPLTKASDETQITTTFDANGGEAVTAIKSKKTATYKLTGYKNGTTTYKVGDEFTVNEDTSFVGVFADDEVIYESFTLPMTTRHGYRFLGWAINTTETTGITGTYEPTSELTLHAIWEKIEYKPLDEDIKFEYTVGNKTPLTYTIDAPFEKFVDLYIDNHKLEKGVDYTALNGSTIITFTEVGMNYIDNLLAGDHSIKAEFSDMEGTVDVELKVKAAPGPVDPVDPTDPTDPTEPGNKEKSPKTSDNIITYIILEVLALAIGLVVLFKLKIRKAN